MTTTGDTAPLDALVVCSCSLGAALMDATNAVTGCVAPAKQSLELADQIAAAVDHCERLTTVVTGDVRAEQATQGTPGPFQPARERGSSTDASAEAISECDSAVNDVEDSDTPNRTDPALRLRPVAGAGG